MSKFISNFASNSLTESQKTQLRDLVKLTVKNKPLVKKEVYNKSLVTNKILKTLEYYINSPQLRCSGSGGDCYYGYEGLNDPDRVYTEGCAVGMHLTYKQKKWADETMRDVTDLIEDANHEDVKLPLYIIKNASIWNVMQSWHDNDSHWEGDKMSAAGARHFWDNIILKFRIVSPSICRTLVINGYYDEIT